MYTYGVIHTSKLYTLHSLSNVTYVLNKVRANMYELGKQLVIRLLFRNLNEIFNYLDIISELFPFCRVPLRQALSRVSLTIHVEC